MQCVEVNSFGQVVESTQDPCPFVLIEATDFLATASLTPANIAYSFAWGFGAVVTLWALSFAVRAALKAINLI